MEDAGITGMEVVDEVLMERERIRVANVEVRERW